MVLQNNATTRLTLGRRSGSYCKIAWSHKAHAGFIGALLLLTLYGKFMCVTAANIQSCCDTTDLHTAINQRVYYAGQRQRLYIFYNLCVDNGTLLPWINYSNDQSGQIVPYFGILIYTFFHFDLPWFFFNLTIFSVTCYPDAYHTICIHMSGWWWRSLFWILNYMI